jgi:methylmalonyl-CoA mutase N-terminal domain/subunit
MKKGPENPSSQVQKEAKNTYRPEDIAHLEYTEDVGDPGQFPFTRGIHRQMYRHRLWTMRQYAGFGTAEEANERYRYLLSQGTTGLSVAFDLPTQHGLDSDDPAAEGEVGRVGVAIDCVEDMDRLFDRIPLAKISTSMTINATAAILLAFYLVVARRRGVRWEELDGTVQNDILKEYIARGTYIYPPSESLRLVVDLIEFCSRFVPQWNSVSVSGYHIREAGSTAAQEIAFTLANAETYVTQALERGMKVDDFASRLSFFFNVHNDFFEEIAKFRAARRLWARMMKHRYSAQEPRAQMLRFHAQTAGSALTAQQPENNAVRVTLQALAAVLGGTQSLHTCAKDEALALPTEESARLAIRTQQIVAHESGVGATADPVGGSWYVESLTDRLAKEAETYLEKVRSMGGMPSAIQKGYVQKEIQEAAYQFQLCLEEGKRLVVGVNSYIDTTEEHPEIWRADPETEKRARTKLSELRARRDSRAVQAALAKVQTDARRSENLLPAIIDSAEASATVGEISNALRQVFGSHRETVVI